MNGLLLRHSDLSRPFYQECLQRGLILYYKLNASNVLRMSPPLVISAEHIDEATTIMGQACHALASRA